MVVQNREILLVVTASQHNTNQISKTVPNDFPIATGYLRIPCHHISSDSQSFGSDLCVEKLHGQVLLIQKESQVAMFAISTYTGHNFPRPGYTYGADTVSLVTVCVLIMLQDTSVCEVSGWIQMRKHGAFDAFEYDEQVIR